MRSGIALWRPLVAAFAAALLLCRAALVLAVPPAPTFDGAGDFAAQWPAQGHAVFEVRHVGSGVVVGRSEHRWQHDGQKWSVKSVTEPAGLASLFSRARALQESRGIFVPGGLQPLEFHTEKNGKPKDSARFDLVAGRIALGNGENVPLAGRTQDLLSLFYQLGAEDLARSRFTLILTTGRKVATYEVAVRPVETLESGAGRHQARPLRIVPAGDAQGNERTEVWLDVANRLPVRIRYRDRKGEVFDQMLASLELGNPK